MQGKDNPSGRVSARVLSKIDLADAGSIVTKLPARFDTSPEFNRVVHCSLLHAVLGNGRTRLCPEQLSNALCALERAVEQVAPLGPDMH